MGAAELGQAPCLKPSTHDVSHCRKSCLCEFAKYKKDWTSALSLASISAHALCSADGTHASLMEG